MMPSNGATCEHASQPIPVTSEIIQVSFSGPLTSLIYVKDILSLTGHSTHFLFANDITVTTFKPNAPRFTAEIASKGLSSTGSDSSKWVVTFSAVICNFIYRRMHYHPRISLPEVTSIDIKRAVCDLGQTASNKPRSKKKKPRNA